MATRNLRYENDELLRKKSKPVKEITKNIITLLEDMAETMEIKNGIGLAAPQVGILKRIFIVNFGEESGIIEFINPEILETTGIQNNSEGCLSVPGKAGYVERPEYVKVQAQDRCGNKFIMECEGLMAVAICHETDHLNGILYTDLASEMFDLE